MFIGAMAPWCECKKDRKKWYAVLVYEDFGKYVGINTIFSGLLFLALVDNGKFEMSSFG